MSSLFCSMVQGAGKWSKQTRGDWKFSTMDASDAYDRTCAENGHYQITKIWTPQGKRKPGRPKTTWTVTQELEQLNLLQGEAQFAAKDQLQWRELIEVLSPIEDEEE